MIVRVKLADELTSQLVRPVFFDDRVHLDYHHVEKVIGEPIQDSIVHRSEHLDAIHFLSLGLLRKQLLLYELLQELLGDEILHSFPLLHEDLLYHGILKLIS